MPTTLDWRSRRHKLKMTPLDFKLWRVARGLTQRQCAELFGVKQQTISLWETIGPPARLPTYTAFDDEFAQIDKQLREPRNVPSD